MGLGGLCLKSNVVLEVGTQVLLELSDPQGNGSAELKGKVMWQGNTRAGSSMGVKVFEDDETAQMALGDWLHAALKEQSGLAELRGRQRVLVDLALASKDTENQLSVWQRLRPTGTLIGANVATATF